jgi:hypothetical protein
MHGGTPGRSWQGLAVGPARAGAVRRLLVVLYLVLMCAGAVAYPLVTVVGGIVLGATAWSAMVLLYRLPAAQVAPRPYPGLAAAVMAGLPAATCGSALLDPLSTPIVGTALFLAVVLMLRWIFSARPPGAQDSLWCPHSEQDTRRLLTTLPTDLLLEEWQATQRQIAARGGSDRGQMLMRDLLIDEFASRDPEGTLRWLRDGLDRPPTHYIQPDVGPEDHGGVPS